MFLEVDSLESEMFNWAPDNPLLEIYKSLDEHSQYFFPESQHFGAASVHN